MNHDQEQEKRLRPENFEPICTKCEDHVAEEESEGLCANCGYLTFK
jgi:Zn finger protein HypA/HybF involved in hydrogenase expression